MDAEDLGRQSGWRVHHRLETASTNDDAAALAEGGAAPRTVVVADAQAAGRGRAGRVFASPPGGLYASLLLEADPADVPAAVVALVAVAAAEAVEDAAGGTACGIKWPNDLWLDGRKVGGILLETRGEPGRVIAGVGINVAAVPADLPDALRPQLTALAEHAPAPDRDELLRALLARVDAWQARRRAPDGLAALERAWRERLVLIGEAVRCVCAGEPLEGVLEDVALARGLLLRDALSGPVWRLAEHVQDLRPADRTI